MGTEAARVGQLTEDSFRLLADPAQEVLIEHRPVLSQRAAVPLVTTDSFAVTELSSTRTHRQE